MKEKEILDSVKRSMDQAPIDILQNIKNAPKTKMLRHDEITKQKTKENIFKKFMPYASIAAAFILVFFGWQYQTRMPDSNIYIDVNPSIEITTNRLNKVIHISAANGDGKLLTEDFHYKGMWIDKVAEEILDRMINERYLGDDNEFLLLSVYNKNEEKAELQKLDLDKKIHEYLKQKDFQPIVLSQKLEKTSTIENYAMEYGVSISKMTFIRNLIILNPKLQTKNLVDLSIEELVSLSQDMKLDLDKIIDSTDFQRIQSLEEQGEDYSDQGDGDYDKTFDEKPEEFTNSRVSIDQAKKVALDLVGGGRITEFELDDDEYEIEIIKDGIKYEIEIDAYTGKVKEFEKEEDEDYDDHDNNDNGDKDDDYHDNDNNDDHDEITLQNKIISSKQAKNIALSIANGTITDFDYDEDDFEYKVEIVISELEYEITIDAITGEVLEVEIED